jgi:putative ATP-binding cassette transporter
LGIAYGLFGKRLVNAFQATLWTAADLRYSLMRIREHAEAVALSGGDKREKERSEGYFDKHIEAIKENTWVNMAYSACMNLLHHFPHLIIWLYQIPMILSGRMHMGDAVRVLQGYDQVAKVLDFFSNQLIPITVLQANAERFNVLWKACREENAMSRKTQENEGDDHQPGGGGGGNDERRSTPKIEFKSCEPHLGFAFENVVVNAPGSNIQVGGVSFSGEKGKAVLVSGASGLGKSSVLKCMAGLWPNGAGIVKLSEGSEIMLLPSTCYIPKGTLLEVAIYPRKVPTDKAECRELEKDVKVALCRAHLESVLTRWGLIQEERDWNVIFSPGERQRVAFARLFLKLAQDEKTPVKGVKGLITILDESTSAIDIATEAKLYNSIRSELTKGSLIAVISVGHRATLPEFHETELQIGHLRHDHEKISVLSQGTWMMPDGEGTPWRFIELQDPGA